MGATLSGEHVERRLAAILAADVAGSCRLIGIDEEGTLARLKALRRTLFDPKIAEHRGRLVKNTGDGALVEFSSLVDAVRCAVEIQRGMAEQNIDVRRTNGSNFASAFTSVILSSKTMISLVTASTLRYVSKGSQNRVC
jgi:class 3 adenylate cyclase